MRGTVEVDIFPKFDRIGCGRLDAILGYIEPSIAKARLPAADAELAAWIAPCTPQGP
jgi:hypothetical protein